MKTTHPSKPALRQTSRRILTASIATALAVALLPSPSAQAFDITSAANGNWNASGTWNPTTVPDITKTVDVFGNTVTVTANASAQNLTVDNGGTLTLNSGVTLMTNALTIGSGPGGGSTGGTVNGSGQLMIGPGLNMNVILAGPFVGLGNTIVDYNPGAGAVASKVTIDNYFEEVGWSGNNTYTGGTDINVGGNPGPGSGVHLQLNIRGSLNCFGTGAVTLHGTSDTYALRLSMSNQGGFANQLIVHGGASLLNGSWDGNISLADASSVLATRDGITLNGVISGPGSLAIQNNTTISNASNTYTGKTSVYAGTLRIGQ